MNHEGGRGLLGGDVVTMGVDHRQGAEVRGGGISIDRIAGVGCQGSALTVSAKDAATAITTVARSGNDGVKRTGSGLTARKAQRKVGGINNNGAKRWEERNGEARPRSTSVSTKKAPSPTSRIGTRSNTTKFEIQ